MNRIIQIILAVLLLYIVLFKFDYLYIKTRKYQNEKYKFSFTYPNDTDLFESDSGDAITVHFKARRFTRFFALLGGPPEGIAIHVFRNRTLESEIARAKGNTAGPEQTSLVVEDFSKSDLSGKAMIGSTDFNGLSVSNKAIVFQRGGEVFTMSASWYKGAERDWEEYFRQIVDSLKY
jgi:hypothetical protein